MKKKRINAFCFKATSDYGAYEIHTTEEFREHYNRHYPLEYIIFNYSKYLHNEYGPAIITPANDYNRLYPFRLYWLEGKSFNSEKEWSEALIHYRFPDRLDKILG